jgi:hypothetical protein
MTSWATDGPQNDSTALTGAITPYTLADLREARTAFLEARTDNLAYVVMDPESYRAILGELAPFFCFKGATSRMSVTQFGDGMEGYAGLGDDGSMLILGLRVVVIPTDGLPMLKVVGWPGQEAMR